MKTLDEALRELTAPSAPELVRKLEDGRTQCLACGHRCKIAEGHPGVCRVRYVEGGVLRRPSGYVGALACDPIEKKPFFHAFPGRDALTFGMLGCDFRCAYCFPGETMVITHLGPMTFADLFSSCRRVEERPDAEIAYPDGLKAVAAAGNLRGVRAVFKHPYRGQLTVLNPYYLPPISSTPDHRIYATLDVDSPPKPIEARLLTQGHYLAVPRRYYHSSVASIDSVKYLDGHRITHRIRWKLSNEDRQMIAVRTAGGESSRAIGLAMGKSASYVRHVRCKMARGLADDSRTSVAKVERGNVRFPREHGLGIPTTIPVDAELAALLGYYCAEGCVVRSKNRPNSQVLNFSFGHSETRLISKVNELLQHCLGVQCKSVRRATTSALAACKASAAALLRGLAGSRGGNKRVPSFLFHASETILRSFLEAYVEGDGHRYSNGKVSVTTISRELAHGIAWAALKLGYFASLYEYPMAAEGVIQGRKVKRSPHQYTVVWYEQSVARRRMIERDDYYLVPLRSVATEEYTGDVFNMEVEDEHNYLAGFFLVSNCQNWETSQVLRDDDAVAPPRPVSAEQLVEAALDLEAPVIASSYNEPLITSDWAVEVFRAARLRGLTCAMISNGNGTPEVLEYLRPHVDLYKVDLKGFTDKAYKDLGGKLPNVLETIQRLKKLGFWVEIVTLVIPNFNDDPGELRAMAEFLSGVDRDMPWHVTAFHPDYRMTDRGRTVARTLIDAYDIGRAAGLRFIYPGNLPGQVGDRESTFCPACRALLIRRRGFLVLENRMRGNACPACRRIIPGVWEADPPRRTVGSGLPRAVRL